jgi:hypothetical protein
LLRICTQLQKSGGLICQALHWLTNNIARRLERINQWKPAVQAERN